MTLESGGDDDEPQRDDEIGVASSTSSSNDEEQEQQQQVVVEVDCPICLDTMNEADHQHPLLCTTRNCGYNFCLSCIESLISSSKDDYMEASDGNRHVKVYLHCPNCRSDLGSTICDTVLLRRADTVTTLLEQQQQHVTEEQLLTPSQLQMKHALEELDVQAAIEEARENEAEFLARQEEEEESEDEESVVNDDNNDGDNNNTTQDVEEWGVEADLIHGVLHQSFRMPREYRRSDTGDSSTMSACSSSHRKKIDTSLFAGLDYFMTHAEKLHVTKLMTSGDCSKLATAAKILKRVEGYCHQGIPPSKRTPQRKGSVYVIVDEAIKAHAQAASNKPPPKPKEPQKDTARAYRRPPKSRATQKAAEHRRVDREVREQMEYMQLHPLPVRMPKLVELDLVVDPSRRGFPLSFCNDMWDGTVLDAYSKITIITSYSRCENTKICKKTTENKGVFHVLSGGKYYNHYDEVQIGSEQQRVLVSSVQGMGGKQGIMKGDVVTHVNGEEFSGNTDDLLATIRACMDQNDGSSGASKFQMVLNAEPSIAEALRRRALVY